jgi:hypothetical protein
VRAYGARLAAMLGVREVLRKVGVAGAVAREGQQRLNVATRRHCGGRKLRRRRSRGYDGGLDMARPWALEVLDSAQPWISAPARPR